jgi:leucyl-tRNA synthetase
MVVHETYRLGSGGRTASGFRRDDRRIEETDGKRRATLIATGEPVEIGSIEKMSKSKKNVVDPDDIIASYGADTARWFVLSDSPPERDVVWTEAGVEGAHRFVQRVWRARCWSALGHARLVATQGWPVVDRALLVEDVVVLPVQVNGKRRGEVTVRRDAPAADVEAAALSLDEVRRHLEGRAPKKVIVVPQRIVNVVG